jgi:hypothetical protein
MAQWRDEFLLRFLEEFLERNGVSPASLLVPPRPEGPASRAYCPVCLTQYVVSGGSCQDCGNIPLARF